jgi:hypothetical protein
MVIIGDAKPPDLEQDVPQRASIALPRQGRGALTLVS